MAHTKSAGSTSNGRDSQAKYLGVKLHDGAVARTGNVILRQRGTRVLAGKGVSIGHDHTLYATYNGTVKFTEARSIRFNGERVLKKMVSVVAS